MRSEGWSLGAVHFRGTALSLWGGAGSQEEGEGWGEAGGGWDGEGLGECDECQGESEGWDGQLFVSSEPGEKILVKIVSIPGDVRLKRMIEVLNEVVNS